MIPWPKEVWHPCIQPKHSFILWLAARAKLRTRDKLGFLETSPLCAFCGTIEESNPHLFFACPFTADVWHAIRTWIGIHRASTTIASSLKWLKKEARGTGWQSRAKRMAFASTVYHIWATRNRLIFEDTRTTVDELIFTIKTNVYKAMFTLYPSVLIEFERLAVT